MAVRSKAFTLLESELAGGFVSYTVPEGRTAVIKDIRVYNANPLSQDLVAVGATLSGESSVLAAWEDLETSGHRVSDGMFAVLPPGTTIDCYATLAFVRFHISGAELVGVA